MRHLLSRPHLASRSLAFRSIAFSSLLLGALSCSDDADPTPANGGSAGSSANAGSSGSGGSAGTAGTAGSGGGAGASGSAGTGGTSGAGGTAGAGGSEADAGGGDAGFPVPDKLVALSFDDGPDATATNLVLDKLEAYGVPASFFLIGQNIGGDDAAVLARAAALGCEFENHSSDFGSLDMADEAAINTAIDSTNTAILNATGEAAVFFRPPNLATSQLMFSTIDMPFAGGLVGGDFPAEFGGNPTVEAVSNTILNGVQDGTIILLHDVQPLPHPTPAALDIIIPELKRRGFEILTVRQLFARRNVDPTTPANQDIAWASVPPLP